MGTSTTSAARAVEQLPHAFVAVERRELLERAAMRTRAGVRDRRRSAHAASGASPRPASSALDACSADTGLVSEHQHEHGCALVDRRQGDAAIDDEQPSPKCRSRQHEAAQVDGLADLGGAAADDTQRSWSNGHSRATPSTCPSSVPVPYGSSCLGWPSRFDAARGEHETGDELAVLIPRTASVHRMPHPRGRARHVHVPHAVGLAARRAPR